MNEIKKITFPEISSETKDEVIYIRENTDLYNKTKEDDRSYDFIEDTDKYKKSGIKVIKTIKLEL